MQRPTSVTVIAVLGIIFGIFGLCGIGFQLLGNAMGGDSSAPGMELQKSFTENEAMKRYQNMGLIAGIIFTPLLFIGSIGSLMMKTWGRSTMLAYSVFSILYTLGSTTMYFMVVNPAVQKILQEYSDAQSQQMAGVMMITMNAAIGCGLIMGLLYPIATLLVMINPHVKQAFEGSSSPPPYSE